MLNFRDKNKIFVTSDTHFGHLQQFVWGKRGFLSAQDHDNKLIDMINATVKEDDILFHLGDFCLNTSNDKFEEYISRINCQNIYLIFGNHPNPHYKNVYVPLVKSTLGDAYEDGMELYPLRYKNVIYIGHRVEAILGGQFCVLDHYPILVWNEMMHGAWMLCGHSHYGCPHTVAENTNGKILDMGWDGHGKPWSWDEISAVMKTKQFVATDQHHK